VLDGPREKRDPESRRYAAYLAAHDAATKSLKQHKSAKQASQKRAPPQQQFSEYEVKRQKTLDDNRMVLNSLFTTRPLTVGANIYHEIKQNKVWPDGEQYGKCRRPAFLQVEHANDMYAGTKTWEVRFRGRTDRFEPSGLDDSISLEVVTDSLTDQSGCCG